MEEEKVVEFMISGQLNRRGGTHYLSILGLRDAFARTRLALGPGASQRVLTLTPQETLLMSLTSSYARSFATAIQQRQHSETGYILAITMARLSGFLGALLLPLLAAGIQLEFSINSQNGVLPNPSKLPSSTNAILSSLGAPLVAPITASNTFLFSSVPAGSYLLSVFSRDAVFEDLRVDVVKNDSTESASSWTTFRGNEWDNKGELRGSGEGSSVQIEVRPLASKDYYQERSTCRCHSSRCTLLTTLVSVISIFKSPMILIAIFSLAMVVGMPYLMDNCTIPVFR
jgi:hypothetical protein